MPRAEHLEPSFTDRIDTAVEGYMRAYRDRHNGMGAVVGDSEYGLHRAKWGLASVIDEALRLPEGELRVAGIVAMLDVIERTSRLAVRESGDQSYLYAASAAGAPRPRG